MAIKFIAAKKLLLDAIKLVYIRSIIRTLDYKIEFIDT